MSDWPKGQAVGQGRTPSLGTRALAMSQSHEPQSHLTLCLKNTHGPHKPPVPPSWKKPWGLTDTGTRLLLTGNPESFPKGRPRLAHLQMRTEIQQVAKLGSPKHGLQNRGCFLGPRPFLGLSASAHRSEFPVGLGKI